MDQVELKENVLKYASNIMQPKCKSSSIRQSSLIKMTNMSVVYFNQLSGAARTQNLVSAVVKLFCSCFTFFSDYTPEINKKRLKMNKKTCFCLLLKAG